MEEWQKWEESIEVKIPSGFQLRRVSRPWAREFSTHIPEILRFWTFGKRLNAVIGEPSLRNVSSRQEAGSVPITKASQAVWTVWSVTSSTPTCKICKICKWCDCNDTHLSPRGSECCVGNHPEKLPWLLWSTNVGGPEQPSIGQNLVKWLVTPLFDDLYFIYNYRVIYN